jgi:hypothetical protein
LDVLLKGKSEDQARARTEIAMILEERGFADDAEEAYWTNVQSNSADRRAYERLISLYQERKDRLSESLVRRKLDEVFSAGATPRGTVSAQPFVLAQLPAPSQAPAPARAPATAALPATTTLPVAAGHGGDVQPARPVRRLRSAAAQNGTGPAPERRDNPRLGSPSASEPPMPRPGGQQAPTSRPSGQQQALAAPQAGARRSAPAAGPAPAASRAPRRQRYAPLAPNPGRGSWRETTKGLIVLQPATIAAFLLASIGAAAVISFIILAFDRGGMVPVASAAAQASTGNKCADASVRFPGVNDPRAAVVAAYKQQGIDVDAPRAGGPRVSTDQAELVVGGWMAVSLMMAHNGQPAPTLTQWLDPGSTGSTLANAILAGRGLDSMLTHDEWSDMRSWPASTCEGAFVRDSHNAALMKLIERVVTK